MYVYVKVIIMNKKLTMKNPKAQVKIATPVGRFLWLSLANPKPEDAPMQAGKYTCTVAWDKDSTEAREAINALKAAVEQVGRDAYGDQTLKLGEFPQSVIKDGDSTDKDYLQGLEYTSAATSAKFPPKVYGPVMKAGAMSKEDIEKISQGDYGRMVITISAYKTPALNGVTCYLQLVQFAKKGEFIGKIPGTEMLGDLEVKVDDVTESPEVETSSEDFFNF